MLCGYPFVVDGSLAITTTISLAYLLDQPWSKKYITLSYKDAVLEDSYDKGLDDLYFVFFWVNVWSVVRILLLRRILFPFGVFLKRISNPLKCARFSEEGWVGLFHLTSFIWGAVCFAGCSCFYSPLTAGHVVCYVRRKRLARHEAILDYLPQHSVEQLNEVLLSDTKRLLAAEFGGRRCGV
jgi:hypothetical protein